jgi:hypothetical protein
MRSVPVLALLLVVAGLVALGMLAVSCEQNLGERCQSSADCEDGLICNVATGTCAMMSAGGIDATVPDAPADSPIDAPIDAM